MKKGSPMSAFRLFVFDIVMRFGFWLLVAPGLWPETTNQPTFTDADDQARFELIRSLNENTLNTALDEAMKAHDPNHSVTLFARTELQKKGRVRDAVLSPDGVHIAYLLGDKKNELWLMKIDSGERTHLLTAKIRRLLQWSPDSIHLFFEVSDALASIQLGNKEPLYLTSLDKEKREQFLRVDPKPNHILMSRINEEEEQEIYRVGPDGSEQELYRGRPRIQDFLTGPDGNLIFIKKAVDDYQALFFMEENGWQELARFDMYDDADLLYWDDQKGRLLVRCRYQSDLIQLFQWDRDSGKWTSLHKDPEGVSDMSRVTQTGTGRPELVHYHIQNSFRAYGLNKETQKHVEKIEDRLPNRILNYTIAGGGVWLVRESSATMMERRFYIYRENEETLSPILDGSELLTESQLAPKWPISFRAGDGFLVHGYVSFPRGGDLSKLPVVVKPHGGPFAYSSMAFSKTTQLLVNRGYIVIEPNFRGSLRYGLKYITASKRDFGDGVVQQDIIDSVFFVLSKGLGDWRKLGIYGASFGGFSAICGLTFTPKLFQVGVAAAPPSDLGKTMMLWDEDRDLFNGVLRNPALKASMVDPHDSKDMARLRALSPETHAERIERPLLLIAGKQDPQVSVLLVRDYALRLEGLKKKVSLFVAEDEGHSFHHPLAQRAHYYLLERMMALYLGGDYEPIKDPALARYLSKELKIDHNQLTSVNELNP